MENQDKKIESEEKPEKKNKSNCKDIVIKVRPNITDEEFLNSDDFIPFDFFHFCPVGGIVHQPPKVHQL